MKRILPFLLVIALLAALLIPFTFTSSAAVKLLSGSEVKNKFDSSANSVKEVYRASNGKSLPYRLYVPDDYDPSKNYPLVLFFHGAGERGTDNNAQISAGSAMQRLLLPEEQKRFPCLILAPQCPGDSQWVLSDWGPGVYNHNTMQTPVSPYMKAAEELLEKVIGDYSVDENRLYVTGMSMGGFGTWDIISRNPEKFAAAFPVCGGVDETYLDNLQGFPIYTFHNVGDTIVSSAGTKKAYEILKDAGGITYIEYNSSAHDAWSAAYATDDLTRWVFTKTRSAMVQLPEVDGITFVEAPYRATVGKTLKLSFTAEEGYGLAGLTVGGKTYAAENVTAGEVSIGNYQGGEITAVAGKLAKISVSVDGAEAVTNPDQYVVGQTVELELEEKDGYAIGEVKVGDTVIVPDADGAYVLTLTDEETVVLVSYVEIGLDDGEGDTDTDTDADTDTDTDADTDTDTDTDADSDNKTETEEEETEEEEKNEEKNEESDSKKDDDSTSTVIVIVTIVVIVLMTAAAIVIIIKKKR